ncbi:hypothetical protein CDD81_4744 [Ophiocordyceps australis]|uniref:LysM domain-containing protein n=1 Tax=Ophiocordyceps australis TaxID=1399860 RepID=A0A2C5XNA1_9HYPO|nr:hypothetical protein CDD81_4744 [Ophiocordyceps australis]
MTEPQAYPRPSARLASSALSPAPHALSSSVRPRTRTRQVAAQSPSALLTASASRSTSPRPTLSGRASPATAGSLGQFLGESWTQSWSSVQGFATSLLSKDHGPDLAWQQRRSRSRGRSLAHRSASSPSSWGPHPPPQPTHVAGTTAASSLAQREAALKTARTASVLQSHDGVNGGLDVAGVHKRRLSGDDMSDATAPEDCLVYMHPVEPDDTYAGIILRYQCQEDVFRRANGLWSRDSIQTRKRLVIPVDACQIRSRPCQAPPCSTSHHMDSLVDTTEQGQKEPQQPSWTHFSWVQIETLSRPVQICRVSRHVLGYFPPRRKNGRVSTATTSLLSTPRQSSDLASALQNSPEQMPPSPRQGPPTSRVHHSVTPVSVRSRVGSDVGDRMPEWLRRPGGVGTMSGNVRAPGPDGDYLNSWTRKHLPGLTIAGLPSMSVMGSETARFGFTTETAAIVESSFEEGRDVMSASRQGSGLDRAAAAVENWLRGAWTGRPSTPLIGSRARPDSQAEGDLIELMDTASEDDRLLAHNPFSSLTESGNLSSTSNSDHHAPIVGRLKAD